MARSAAPTWTTAASTIASGRRWWCRRRSICRRPLPAPRMQLANWPQGSRRAPPQGRHRSQEEDRAAAGPRAGDQPTAHRPSPINIAPPVDPPAAHRRAGPRPAYASDAIGTASPIPSTTSPAICSPAAPSDIGDSIGIGNLFGGKGEVADVEPGTEPARQALTQPPAGYQTPSPNYAYGERTKGLLDGTSNPDRNPLSAAVERNEHRKLALSKTQCHLVFVTIGRRMTCGG